MDSKDSECSLMLKCVLLTKVYTKWFQVKNRDSSIKQLVTMEKKMNEFYYRTEIYTKYEANPYK